MWDKSSWPERILAIWALLIASVAVLFVGVSLGMLISENSSTVASWVQAVGSIGTIAVGVWAVVHQLSAQRREAYKRAVESERGRFTRAAQILQCSTADAVLISQKIALLLSRPATDWNVVATMADTLSRSLYAVVPSDLPNPAAGLLLGGVRGSLLTLAIQCRYNATATEITTSAIDSCKNAAVAIHQTALQVDLWLKHQIRMHATEEEYNSVQEVVKIFASSTGEERTNVP